MRKSKYRVYYGNAVPYQPKDFTSWVDASCFIVRCMKEGIEIHSVAPITDAD